MMFHSNELTHDPIDPINEAIPFLLLAKISQYTLWLKVHSHTTQFCNLYLLETNMLLHQTKTFLGGLILYLIDGI